MFDIRLNRLLIVAAALGILRIQALPAQTPSADQELIFPIAVDLLAGNAPVVRTLYVVMNLGADVTPKNFQFFHNEGASSFLDTFFTPVPANGISEQPRNLDISVIQQNGWARLVLPPEAKVRAWANLLIFTRVGNVFQLLGTAQVDAVKPAKSFA